MKGYNPHNALHEYHAAMGGCVSDAKKAEARIVGNEHTINCALGAVVSGIKAGIKAGPQAIAPAAAYGCAEGVVLGKTGSALIEASKPTNVKCITSIKYDNSFLNTHSPASLLELFQSGGIDAVNNALDQSFDLGFSGDLTNNTGNGDGFL